ncbi:C40 family peptidase [Lutibacter sp. B1]|uniref:C40 family peptidase n=1 Tax=Lutibacter sp. B1 TaxID=2725996 RepID=UPI001457663D|nr:C40 family peptidase [Lutibacter sp. B1]NLP57794.1 LysM peptidoglycan-binding domain-containing protein [Lutibacter sp. B1]
MNIYKLFTFIILLTNTIVFSQTTIKHTVIKGESIYAIAKKYNVKEAAIYQLNPNVKGKLLQLNTILEIPNNQNTIKENNKITLHKDSSQVQTHIVAAGETLYKISKKYGTTIQELKRLNPKVKKILPTGYLLILKEEIPSIESSSLEVETKVEPNLADESSEEKVTLEPSKTTILIDAASKKLGTKYKRGGTNNKGFDCSGLIFTIFKEINITLPKSSNLQAKTGTKIEQSQAQKGDLIFFTTNGKGTINHVGIITEVLKNEIKFIHASVQLGVIISSTKEPYYSKRFVQINRIL